MAIKVGITEGVRLAGAELNDKGTLVIKLSEGAPIDAVATDDLLNQNAGYKPQGETTIMLWPIDVESQGAPREADKISKDVAGLRDQLQHILEGYMPSNEAKLDVYANTGLTGENYNSLIVKQATVAQMYNNLVKGFIAKVQALSPEALAQEFRILLLRRSAANHYGTFRKNFISDNPFFERMSVPKEASKLAFTKYEIEKGMNNGTPIAKEQVADKTDAAQSTADDILGSR